MDHPDPKPGQTTFTPAPPRQPYRRRRIIWVVVSLFALVFFFGAPWEFPAEGFSSISRANIVQLTKQQLWYPDEIFGLLHFVTRDDGRVLSHDSDLDPRKPIRFDVYEKANGNWTQFVQSLEAEYPVVVFSKTYCPYSRKAKTLLKAYDLAPAPKIIEVDLREDGDLLKVILGRLTGRATFPNIILHGKTLGGSDDIQALHNGKRLKPVFEGEGVRVLGDPEQTTEE